MSPQTDRAETGTRPDAIHLHAVRFGWEENEAPHIVLDELRVFSGERLFVEGPSGSGKSTLLGLLAGVTVPQAGEVVIRGETLSALGPAQRDRFRADHIGYIFQMFNLIPYLTVAENVTLPLRFSKRRRARVGNPDEEAGRLLEQLGMSGYLHRPVSKLSVGQQQRVAAARALIGAPEIILADEPTSSLDAGHSERFINLLFKQCELANATLIFVSHNHRLATLFDRTYTLENNP
jgi:putative ABC transport system ATP-binding protein